ncbi:MAG: bifunctional UDP-N-acetylglucosamine diphosphorylase/glucosamine-1-phosphate N-acetyltransferase GlmU [Solirubrobacterales bacterium]|nr:bifunctional UDP-N-acetylglucosamine diphosphorylase/glucosamine-1-phosphate N-acetyltransferase GlmU [Solirubrobacterales bacterium]
MPPVSAPTVLIMAAGQGTRMRSAIPKVLHPICGRPLVSWPIEAAREAGAGRIAVIVSPERDITGALPDGIESVPQPDADGTGGALRAAAELIEGSAAVIVLSGDVPLVSAELIAAIVTTHESEAAAATVVTAVLDDPGAYGRVIRSADGADVERIVEAKAEGDATAEQLAIDEINAGIYVFDGPRLAAALPQLSNDNAQGEYYLPDVLPLLREAGGRIVAHVSADPNVILGVNSRADLALVETEARRQILRRHMLAGVTIVDPASTWIEVESEIATDVRIEPGCSLIGVCSIGTGSVIGPHSTLIDSRVGADVTVPHSYLVECDVADRCSVGPFAYLRPHAELGEGAKAGTFVEIKNSRIGAGSKVPHLSYIGDADVGEGANLGAATITANYDGFTKSRTKIGHGARTSVDTTLVAPVEVGDSAYTGAGSVITEDVPAGALGIARAEQTNVEGFAERKASEAKKVSQAEKKDVK